MGGRARKRCSVRNKWNFFSDFMMSSLRAIGNAHYQLPNQKAVESPSETLGGMSALPPRAGHCSCPSAIKCHRTLAVGVLMQACHFLNLSGPDVAP
jgi:hypothetical protein